MSELNTMKVIFLFLVSASFIACDLPDRSNIKKQKLEDSINADANDRAKRDVDSILRNVMFDTANLAGSPVKIVSAKIVLGEGGDYRNVKLIYKNISSKKISAIKFRWYGVDAFGEPADLGVTQLHKGFGGGFADDGLGVGKTSSGIWSVMSRTAKKIVKAWPIEVAFADGSKWAAR